MPCLKISHFQGFAVVLEKNFNKMWWFLLEGIKDILHAVSAILIKLNRKTADLAKARFCTTNFFN